MKGIIDPHSIKEVTINVEACQLGNIQGDLLIKINGSVESPLRCTFLCLCQGPVVNIIDKELNWGLTPLLQDVVKEISITNESLIPAKYTANLVKYFN